MRVKGGKGVCLFCDCVEVEVGVGMVPDRRGMRSCVTLIVSGSWEGGRLEG